jgi:RNA-directed DNA polymerase
VSLFEKIIDDKNLHEAYSQTQKGKSKYKNDAMRFRQNVTFNLRKLKQSIIDGSYSFDGYEEFWIYEPKERLIHAPGYKDKIVQIAINNILKQVLYPKFIYDSYACIDGKGTHSCVDKLQKNMKKAQWLYGKAAYIVRVDIKKFFYNIDRSILKDIMERKINCEKTLMLLFEIIDSADLIGDKGLPLGNTISQISANLYLNELDQYCKRKLGIKFYVRYADDITIIVESKEKATMLLSAIKRFLSDQLKLEININKSKIFPIAQGVNTVGFKIHPTHRLLRNDSKKKVKRKVKKMKRLIGEGYLNIKKAEQMLNSWKGHADNGDSYNFIKKLLSKNDHIYLDKKNSLKINRMAVM